MFLLEPDLKSQASIPAATDEVVMAVALPPDSMWMGGRFSVRAIGGAKSVLLAVHIGLAAYILKMPDPDTLLTMDALWDRLVPKHADLAAADVVELDTTGSVGDPFYEPGLENVAHVVQLATVAHKVMNLQKLVTVLDSPQFIETGSPDTYIPMARWDLELKGHFRIKEPSYFVMAVSSPDTLQTSVSFRVMDTTPEWMQLRNAKDTLTDVAKHAVGLIEAGAQTPYVEAASLFADYMSKVVENTAGAFATVTWEVFTTGRPKVLVPGEFNLRGLDARD